MWCGLVAVIRLRKECRMRGNRYLIGAIPIMFSVMAVGVVRKTPVILRMPLFWATPVQVTTL